jgi:hypothetical protein
MRTRYNEQTPAATPIVARTASATCTDAVNLRLMTVSFRRRARRSLRRTVRAGREVRRETCSPWVPDAVCVRRDVAHGSHDGERLPSRAARRRPSQRRPAGLTSPGMSNETSGVE